MSPRSQLQQAANIEYDPRNDDPDNYMNERMRRYFKQLLETRLAETIQDIERNADPFRNPNNAADMGDRALVATQENLARARLDNLRKVRDKITEVLFKMGSDPSFQYGYDKQGEEIGVGRLLLVPWATTSADDKQRKNAVKGQFPRRSIV